MDAAEWQLKLVQPIEGEPMRFRVFSEHNPTIAYMVNLAEPLVNGRVNGTCECENYRFDRVKKLRELGLPQSRTRCKHIKWAMVFHYEETAPKFALKFYPQTPQRTQYERHHQP